MQIDFFGAARTVTGSKHLISLSDGKKILLDCGMYQGMGKETDPLNRHFGFDPREIDAVILSHAHIDHSGLLPRLVNEGFKGKIYCTPATLDLCEIMLKDSARIQEADVKFLNKKRDKKGLDRLNPLYTEEDVEKCLKHFVTVGFDQSTRVFGNVELLFTDNGHILGSAAVFLTIQDDEKEHKIAFTGDIGRYSSPLLNDPKSFPQCDILICESTYGDRLHDTVEDSAQHLLEIINETCVRRKGRLIIPAFSLGRTQELVYSLNMLDQHGLLPKIKIYVDSPLSYSATNIVRKHVDCLNERVRKTAEQDPDPFGFEHLVYITDKRDSQALNENNEPCVIISASGMAEAGRIRHHIAHAISHPQNTILMVGYAEPHSLGGQLRAGKTEVKIFGELHSVRAEVKIIDSFSAHADYKEMLRYLSCQDASKIKKVFLVHGDYEAQTAWKERLHDQGFRNIEIPDSSDHFIFS